MKAYTMVILRMLQTFEKLRLNCILGEESIFWHFINPYDAKA